MKFLTLLLPLFLFAFQTKYWHTNINISCSQVLHKKAFDICYNCKYKTPNLVVYKLYGNLVNQNNFKRPSSFRPDYNLPKKCRAYTKDYSKTGFDRGHLANNASFDYDRAIQKETFLLSNIAPQKPQLNRRLWAKIERFARLQAVKYKQIEVITGVCGSIGHIKNNVNIPKWWYKIIYIPAQNKYISFLAPNTNTGMSKAKIKQFLVDKKEIERVCGVGF